MSESKNSAESPDAKSIYDLLIAVRIRPAMYTGGLTLEHMQNFSSAVMFGAEFF